MKGYSTGVLGHGARDQFAQTPPWLYDALNAEFQFDFDPAPVDPTFDGLAADWGQSNYVNPPYSETKKWVIKAVIEQAKGKGSVFLIPFKPDTQAFKIIRDRATEIRLIRRKVAFIGYKTPLKLRLCIVVFPSPSPEKSSTTSTSLTSSTSSTTNSNSTVGYFPGSPRTVEEVAAMLASRFNVKIPEAYTNFGGSDSTNTGVVTTNVQRQDIDLKVVAHKIKEAAEHALNQLKEEGLQTILLVPTRSESEHFLASLRTVPEILFFGNRLRLDPTKPAGPSPSDTCLLLFVAEESRKTHIWPEMRVVY